MTRVLMSIMSNQANKIFAATKLWEFRKALPKIGAGEGLTIVVYSSKDERAIVGEFSAGRVLRCPLVELMDLTGYAHDPEAVEWFKHYYGNRKLCGALEVIEPKRYDLSLTLATVQAAVPGFHPPQSFVYLRENNALANLIDQARDGAG